MAALTPTKKQINEVAELLEQDFDSATEAAKAVLQLAWLLQPPREPSVWWASSAERARVWEFVINAWAGMPDDLFDALSVNTRLDGECLVWTGNTLKVGYAAITHRGEREYAHRLVYKFCNGDLIPRLQVDHSCRVKKCLNPKHLRQATVKQNQENLSKTGRGVSGYRGVYLDRRRNAWYGQVVHHQKVHHTKSFATAEEANEAVMALRNNLYTHNEEDRAA